HTARCPAHADTHNSLSVKEGLDGRVLFKCHAGCSFSEIQAALGLLDLGRADYRGKSRHVAALYDYVDEEGRLLYQTVRYEPKSFSQRRPNGEGGFIHDLAGVRRVLYRLPDLLRSATEQPIFICEGEKDADALALLGLVATTNSGGAGKWRT